MSNSNSMQPLKPMNVPSGLFLRTSEEIQGNILAGFLKDHQCFLLLQFPDTQASQNWLNELLPQVATTKQVATFNTQFSNARRSRGGDDPENLRARWINVSLTSHGLLCLSPTLENDLQNPDFRLKAFNNGAASRATLLGDTGLSDPSNWAFGNSAQQPIDAILTVAADDPKDLEVKLNEMRVLASKHRLTIIFEQRGDTLPGSQRGFEHFGFKDGISQPGVKGFDFIDPDSDQAKPFVLGHPGTHLVHAGEFVLGYEREPFPNWHDAIVPQWKTDGSGQEAVWPHPGWMKDGSFQVFRRLSQDVPSWWAQVIAQSQSLPLDEPIDPDLLAAKLVGRWRSGTPLASASKQDRRSARNPQDDNNFNYEDDPHGERTPQFSHIRKMNPRSTAFASEKRRIIRRGIPFGPPFSPSSGRGGGVDAERGLIFNAFMANIEEQFEFLQKNWANNSGFPPSSAPNQNAGPDPVISDGDGPVCLRRTGFSDQRLDFRRFVHTTGAIYAFSPSITTLKRLANGKLQSTQVEAMPAVLRYQYAIKSVPSFDPAVINDYLTNEVFQNIYEGLVTFDYNNQLIPCLAEKWEISNNGMTYTFRLRADAEFHQPFQRSVTADDIKYSFERALYPETNSPTARDYLGLIVGAEEVIKGTTKELIGIQIIDSKTISITLSKPCSYFLATLNIPCCWIVCRDAIELNNNQLNEKSAIGTGPFLLQEYQLSNKVVLAVNNNYYDGKPSLTHIERPLIEDTNQALNMYKNNELDVCFITFPQYLAIEEDLSLKNEAFLDHWIDLIFVVMHSKNQPEFADRRVRQAFAQAINRDYIATELGKGFWLRADSNLPPGIPGHIPNLRRLPYDPVSAQNLLADAGYQDGVGFPSLTLVAHSEPQMADIGSLIRDNLQQNLGINVDFEAQDMESYFNNRGNENLSFYLAGVLADYLDPHCTLSSLLSSETEQNIVGYSNPQFDYLCKLADEELDADKRIAFYQQADQLAIEEDVAILPLLHGSIQWMKKPYIYGLPYNALRFMPHRRTRVVH